MSITIEVNLDATNALRYLETAPERLDGAAYDGVRASTDLLASYAEQAIRGIAGGVYWDIHKASDPAPHGGVGRVVTPPNRPHVIQARPERVGGVFTANRRADRAFTPRRPMLRFEGSSGEMMFRSKVDHPGANPVSWDQGLTGFAEQSERIFEREVAEALDNTGD